MEEGFQERTERPTERRIEEARKKGKVVQSKEIPTALTLLFSTLFFYFVLAKGFEKLYGTYLTYIRNLNIEIGTDNIRTILFYGAKEWLKMVLPFFLLLIFVSFGGNVLQKGFIFTFETIKFNLENINPVSGIKRLFTKRSLAELLKSFIKIGIVSYVALRFILKEIPVILSLSQREPKFIVLYLGESLFRLSLYVSLFFLFLAGLDFLFQKWQYIKDLMMTRQELKEEFKEREGNPIVKARIRSLQRDLARRRMIEEVKHADVVVTNPNTFAIALQYVAHEMPAPKVVAKGAGFVAEKIKERARLHGVPIFEDRLLARTLFYSVKVGEYIPERFYLVVAEILAKVYLAKGKRL